MTRIKYLLLTAICLVCAQAYGQSLLVYHVVGQVSYRVNGVSKPLVMNTKVTAQTSITVPYGGKVELLNEQSKQRVTIKQPDRARSSSSPRPAATASHNCPGNISPTSRSSSATRTWSRRNATRTS